MFKFFKKSDIVNTDFSVSTDKVANNVVSDLVVGTDSSGSIFPLNMFIFECDDAKSGSCDVQSQITNMSYAPSENYINHQLGKKLEDGVIFYQIEDVPLYNPNSNPVNRDGSYKGNVYNTFQKMYYNDYNNAYNIFGFDGFDTSRAKLNLSNNFISLNLKITDSGDKLKPNSINIQNQTGDIVASIKDDGFNNLYLSGTYFINKSEFTSSFDKGFTSFGSCGVSQLINTGSVPPPPVPTPPPPPPPPVFFYYTYEPCDGSGSFLYVSSSTEITISLKQTLYVSSENRCYNYFSTGGNGSNGDIETYTAYADCGTGPCATQDPVYYYIFESCDTSGSLLNVFSGSLIEPNLTIETYDNELSSARCYSSKSFGGDGSDGNIDSYTKYVDCDACGTANPDQPPLYFYIYNPCNGIGAPLEVYSEISTLNKFSTIYSTRLNKCYNYFITGGNGSDGLLENFIQPSSCNDPEYCIPLGDGEPDDPDGELECPFRDDCPPICTDCPDEEDEDEIDTECQISGACECNTFPLHIYFRPTAGYWEGSNVTLDIKNIFTNDTAVSADRDDNLYAGFTGFNNCCDLLWIEGRTVTAAFNDLSYDENCKDNVAPKSNVGENVIYLGYTLISELFTKNGCGEVKTGDLKGQASSETIIKVDIQQYSNVYLEEIPDFDEEYPNEILAGGWCTPETGIARLRTITLELSLSNVAEAIKYNQTRDRYEIEISDT